MVISLVVSVVLKLREAGRGRSKNRRTVYHTNGHVQYPGRATLPKRSRAFGTGLRRGRIGFVRSGRVGEAGGYVSRGRDPGPWPFSRRTGRRRTSSTCRRTSFQGGPALPWPGRGPGGGPSAG